MSMDTVSLELRVSEQMAREQKEIKQMKDDVKTLSEKIEALQARRASQLTKLKPILYQVNMIREPDTTPMSEKELSGWLEKLQSAATDI